MCVVNSKTKKKKQMNRSGLRARLAKKVFGLVGRRKIAVTISLRLIVKNETCN